MYYLWYNVRLTINSTVESAIHTSIVTKDGQNPNKCTATKLPYLSSSQERASVRPRSLNIRESTTVNQPASCAASQLSYIRAYSQKKTQSTTNQFLFSMWSTKQLLSIQNMQCLEGVPVYMYACVVELARGGTQNWKYCRPCHGGDLFECHHPEVLVP